MDCLLMQAVSILVHSMVLSGQFGQVILSVFQNTTTDYCAESRIAYILAFRM